MNQLLDDLLTAVYRFAWRLSRDRHVAEDLTQETLLRAWRQHDKLRSPAAARVWVLRIAYNLWCDAQRRKRVLRHEELQDEQTTNREPDPGAAASDRDEVRQAMAALERLPRRQREVLYLLACQQMNLEEIAETLDMAYGTVKTNLSLARKRLREEFRQHEPVKQNDEHS